MSLLNKAKELHGDGLAIVPTGQRKEALGKGWQKNIGENRIEPNGNFESPDVKGVGIITGTTVDGGYLLAIDVDCYDTDISRKVYEYINEMAGYAMPFRQGEKPKFLVPVRCNENSRKFVSAKFGESKIEVLGMGQQFVAYGYHPKGKNKEYQWFNGEFSVNKAPHLTLEQIKEVVDYFTSLCEANDMEQTQRGTTPTAADEDDFTFGVAPPKLGLSIDVIESKLARLDPTDLPYELTGWIEVGMGLHHETEGSKAGYKLWVDWSRRSPKHGEKIGESEMYRKWKSFEGEKHRYITIDVIDNLIAKQGIDSLDPDVRIEVDDFEDLGEQQEADTPKREPRFTSAAELLSAPITPPSWIVKGMLERDSLAMVYGASGAGKSYAVIKLATAVSLGRPFHNHQTKPGTVVYMCGEGFRGVVDRLRAIMIHDNLKLADMSNLILTNRITDFSSADDIKATIKELRKLNVEPSLIIIDTLARASGGFDENSTSDMNKFVKGCDYIRRQFDGASVLPIHHTGKGDQKSARGSSVLRAAMDVEIMVESADNGLIVSSTKAKDGEPFDKLGFRFHRVNFGVYDEDGDELYSHLIVQDDSVTKEAAAEQKLTPSGKKVVKAFDEIFEQDFNRVDAPQKFIDQFGLNAPSEGIWLTDLRDYYMGQNGHTNQETLRKAFKRGMDDATAKDALAIWNEIVVKL